MGSWLKGQTRSLLLPPIKDYLTHLALPMIIAVGYRVRSTRGTQFRQWATRTLGEYLQKGFVMDDARLKSPLGLLR